MNFLDIIFIIPIAFGAIVGFRRGIIKEIIALISIVTAIYVARYFSPVLSSFLISYLSISQRIAYPLAYIFVLIIFGGGMYILAEMLTRIVSAIKLGAVNRLFGTLLGVLKWSLILSAILCFFAIVDHYIPIKNRPAVQQSLLYKPIESLIPAIIPFIQEEKLINPE